MYIYIYKYIIYIRIPSLTNQYFMECHIRVLITVQLLGVVFDVLECDLSCGLAKLLAIKHNGPNLAEDVSHTNLTLGETASGIIRKKQSVKWIITVSRQRYGKEVWNKQCTQNFHLFSKGFPSGAFLHSHLSSLFMLSAHFVQASAKNGNHRTHLTKVTYPGATVFS